MILSCHWLERVTCPCQFLSILLWLIGNRKTRMNTYRIQDSHCMPPCAFLNRLLYALSCLYVSFFACVFVLVCHSACVGVFCACTVYMSLCFKCIVPGLYLTLVVSSSLYESLACIFVIVSKCLFIFNSPATSRDFLIQSTQISIFARISKFIFSFLNFCRQVSKIQLNVPPQKKNILNGIRRPWSPFKSWK